MNYLIYIHLVRINIKLFKDFITSQLIVFFIILSNHLINFI